MAGCQLNANGDRRSAGTKCRFVPRPVEVLVKAVPAIVAVALAGAGCQKKPPEERPLPPLVAVAEAIGRDVPEYLDEIGTCTAFEVVSIRAQASGRIEKIHFKDGADVKTGDLLFTIDPRPYEAALHQAEASLAQGKAGLVLAQQEFERAKTLLPTKAISKEDYETRESTVAVDEAMVQAGEAAVEVAKVNLDYCIIRSPIDGRTGEALLDQGNLVTANSAVSMLVITRLDPIYADFTITERDLGEVRRRMSDGTLRTQVGIPDDPAALRDGDLTFLDNTVQDASGRVKLRATIRNADRVFWPGQFVKVRLVLAVQKGAVLVPAAAAQVSQKGPYVFVITPESKAELRLVKLGQRQGDLVVVTEGLKAGEKVVISGALAVSPGAPVRATAPDAQAAPTNGDSARLSGSRDAGATSGDRR
jgi:membrane fusion protein, multidrug efflux system